RDRAKNARQDAKRLDDQLAALPRVRAAEVSAAERTADEGQQALVSAQGQVTRAALVLEGARRHAGLQADRPTATSQLGAVELLLADAERIRSDFGEWETPSSAVPALRGALDDLAASQTKCHDGAAARQKAEAIDLPSLARAVEVAADAEAKAEEK